MIRALCIALALVLAWAPISQAASKVALVIGNADYTNATLRNPVNDARDMAGVLQDLGFEVISRTNAFGGDFLRAIEDVAGRIHGADMGLLC